MEAWKLYYDDRFVPDGTLRIVSGEGILRPFKDGFAACGCGSAEAELEKDGAVRRLTITVEPAPISLIMAVGHSIGAGEKGSSEGSLIVPAGRAYSTHESNQFRLLTPVEDVSGLRLGALAENRPAGIDAFDEDGVRAVDSSFSERWCRKTGEKIWFLNACHGGTSLKTWKRGGEDYQHGVELFRKAETVLAAEIAEGHYVLRHMALVNFTCANGDQTWKLPEYVETFRGMWQGFREDLAFDMDGSGTLRTVEAIELNPIWAFSSMGYINVKIRPLETNNGKGWNFYMAVSGEFPDVFMGSLMQRQWVTDAGAQAFFADYPMPERVHGRPCKRPENVHEVFEEGTHYLQVGYNTMGPELAENMLRYFAGETMKTVKFLYENGEKYYYTQQFLRLGETRTVVPEPECGAAGGLRVEAGGSITFEAPFTVKAVSEGAGVLRVLDGDAAVAFLPFMVRA